MPATPEDLFTRLRALRIETRTVEHAPVFTVDEARALRGTIAGGHCKTLFLKNKKGRLWLAVIDEARIVDLPGLSKRLGGGRLSFGKPDLLMDILGVAPGSVTPFALINDPDRSVTVLLDRAMLDHEPLNYHPLVNTATTSIARADLLRFIDACGHEAYILDLDALADADSMTPMTAPEGHR